eukprot:427157-Amorphochlora_amoeboformis.AAC.1
MKRHRLLLIFSLLPSISPHDPRIRCSVWRTTRPSITESTRNPRYRVTKGYITHSDRYPAVT